MTSIPEPSFSILASELPANSIFWVFGRSLLIGIIAAVIYYASPMRLMCILANAVADAETLKVSTIREALLRSSLSHYAILFCILNIRRTVTISGVDSITVSLVVKAQHRRSIIDLGDIQCGEGGRQSGAYDGLPCLVQILVAERHDMLRLVFEYDSVNMTRASHQYKELGNIHGHSVPGCLLYWMQNVGLGM
ncbi:hypothetical protein K438DRAFT_1747888 [Mycena galopus ATCC 62051]|nr:hypothetical protein K438DRAFT_1747888 [Mycena galopus ATCC 62051]